MADDQPTREKAQARVEEAREELEEAQQGLATTVAPGGMAPLTVEVLEGNTVKDEAGVHHGPGDEFVVEGLTAVGLAQAGHVIITGTHDGELLTPEELREAAIEAEAAALEARAEELRSAL